MAKTIIALFFLAALTAFYSVGSQPLKTSDGMMEVVSFVELPSKNDDNFRYCEIDVKGVDGSVKTLKFKAKKTLVANSVEGFVRSMLPF